MLMKNVLKKNEMMTNVLCVDLKMCRVGRELGTRGLRRSWANLLSVYTRDNYENFMHGNTDKIPHFVCV